MYLMDKLKYKLGVILRRLSNRLLRHRLAKVGEYMVYDKECVGEKELATMKQELDNRLIETLEEIGHYNVTLGISNDDYIDGNQRMVVSINLIDNK